MEKNTKIENFLKDAQKSLEYLCTEPSTAKIINSLLEKKDESKSKQVDDAIKLVYALFINDLANTKEEDEKPVLIKKDCKFYEVLKLVDSIKNDLHLYSFRRAIWNPGTEIFLDDYGEWTINTQNEYSSTFPWCPPAEDLLAKDWEIYCSK